MNQEQVKIQMKLKMLDDVFHRTIIALERLEAFLEIERSGSKKELIVTGIGTSRDLHDDRTNVPDKESFFSEIQLQCSALYFQTAFDDKESFESAVRYFLQDILQWYGGRADGIPYNEVEAFCLPIIVALDRQVKSVSEIMEVTTKYVGTIRSIADYSSEVKAKAVMAGFRAYTIATTKYADELKEFEISGTDVSATSHKRGSMKDGFVRLYEAFTTLYDQTLPAKVLVRMVGHYIPELVIECPLLTEDNVSAAITANHKPVSVESCPNESPVLYSSEDIKIDEKQTSDKSGLCEDINDMQLDDSLASPDISEGNETSPQLVASNTQNKNEIFDQETISGGIDTTQSLSEIDAKLDEAMEEISNMDDNSGQTSEVQGDVCNSKTEKTMEPNEKTI